MKFCATKVTLHQVELILNFFFRCHNATAGMTILEKLTYTSCPLTIALLLRTKRLLTLDSTLAKNMNWLQPGCHRWNWNENQEPCSTYQWRLLVTALGVWPIVKKETWTNYWTKTRASAHIENKSDNWEAGEITQNENLIGGVCCCYVWYIDFYDDTGHMIHDRIESQIRNNILPVAQAWRWRQGPQILKLSWRNSQFA